MFEDQYIPELDIMKIKPLVYDPSHNCLIISHIIPIRQEVAFGDRKLPPPVVMSIQYVVLLVKFPPSNQYWFESYFLMAICTFKFR